VLTAPNIVYEFPRANDREVVRCALQEFDGRRVVDLRVWMPRSRDGVLVPSPKGLSIDRVLLPFLEDAVRAARVAIANGGAFGGA
jgi:hypothetical protein